MEYPSTVRRIRMLLCQCVCLLALPLAAHADMPRKYESPTVERPLVSDAKGHTGFIRDWLVLGAFPDPGGRKTWQEPVTPELLKHEVNFYKDMLATTGGEKEIQPWLGETVIGENGQPRTWQAIAADDKTGKVDLGEHFKKFGEVAQHRLGYLACYLKFDETKTAIVSVGSNDGFRLWINGELVGERQVYRGAALDDDMMLVRFRKGTNLMLLKITRDVGNWGAIVRLIDKGYKPLGGVSELVIPASAARHVAANSRAPVTAAPAAETVKPAPGIERPAADAAKAPVVNRVRLFPAPGFADRLALGRIIGSNAGETVGFVELAKIDRQPPEDQWFEIRFDNKNAYRWVKFQGPDNLATLVGEIEFYEGAQKLSGKPFGIVGKTDSRETDKAFDGRIDTWYESGLDGSAYIGLDLGTPANISAPPVLTPLGGQYAKAQQLSITVPPTAEVRYTTDGSIPTATSGKEYHGRIPLGKGFIPVTAIALEKGKFPSPMARASYAIGDVPRPKGLVTYSLGNSLTDTFANYLEAVARSAGHDHKEYLHTWMGTPTDYLWQHPTVAWQGNYLDQFKKLAPIDIMTTQPFYVIAESIDREAEYSGKFYALARETSPNVQLYLYQQWPSRSFETDSWSMLSLDYMKAIARQRGLKPARTWQEGAANQLAYFEALRDKLSAQFPGKPVLIVPTGLALANLKSAYEAGEVPGAVKDRFFEVHSAEKDEKGRGMAVHLTEPGRYFVSLVLYCCFYKEPPDKVHLPESMTKLTPAQDKVYKRIAWQTVKGYKWSWPAP